MDSKLSFVLTSTGRDVKDISRLFCPVATPKELPYKVLCVYISIFLNFCSAVYDAVLTKKIIVQAGGYALPRRGLSENMTNLKWHIITENPMGQF